MRNTLRPLRSGARKLSPKFTILKFVLLGPMYACFFTIMWFLSRYSLPDAEAYLMPVIGPVHISNSYLLADAACWTMDYDKKRDATTRLMSWVVINDKDRYFVSAYHEDDGDPLRAGTAAPGGTHPTRNLCVDLPKEAKDAFSVRVEGAIVFRPNHNLWDLPPHMIPPFEVRKSNLEPAAPNPKTN